MNPRAAITKTLSTTRRLTRDYKVTLSLFIFIAGLAWLVSETPKNSVRLLDDIILAIALILLVLDKIHKDLHDYIRKDGSGYSQ